MIFHLVLAEKLNFPLLDSKILKISPGCTAETISQLKIVLETQILYQSLLNGHCLRTSCHFYDFSIFFASLAQLFFLKISNVLLKMYKIWLSEDKSGSFDFLELSLFFREFYGDSHALYRIQNFKPLARPTALKLPW